MEDSNKRYCTIVFECDLRKIEGNPFHIDTPFGKPLIICKGDQLTEPEVADGLQTINANEWQGRR